MPPAPDMGDELPAGQAAFHTTHWSAIFTARDQDGTAARDALAGLCSTYWYPLYAFVRRRGYSPHDAEDLTQEFFRDFLQKNALLSASPARGKFRSFLLTCLKNFLANERHRAQTQRRGGGQPMISLDGNEAEMRWSLEPANQLTPEALFEKRWALTVLETTMKTLEAEYAAKGKTAVFEDLRGFLPGGQGIQSRIEFAAKRGLSAGAVDVAVHRLRQRFGVLLREQVARTVSGPEEVEEEIRHLISALGQ